MAEGDRLLDRVQTVAEGGLQVDEAADLQALRRPNDVDRPDHVGHGVAVPVVRVLVRRRRVNNNLRPVLVEGAIDHLGVGDGAFDQCQVAVRREVVAPRCLEVVDDRDDVAVADQPIGEVGADKTGSACDENPHSLTSSTGLFNRCRYSWARSWNARCHSSRLSNPQICLPNCVSPSIRFKTRELSISSRDRACCEEKTSRTKSRTGPGDVIHSCSGTGKPILSCRLEMLAGSLERIAERSTCFMLPFSNLTSAGLVAASSTVRLARQGTRD